MFRRNLKEISNKIQVSLMEKIHKTAKKAMDIFNYSMVYQTDVEPVIKRYMS
jgi:hypothetical protein